MKKRTSSRIWLAVTAAVAMFASQHSMGQSYSVTLVSSGSTNTTLPEAINASATIAGYITRGESIEAGQDPQGFLWQGARFHFLDALHNQVGTRAFVVSASGEEAAGQSCIAGFRACTGVLWIGGVPMDLGPFIGTAFGPSGELYGATTEGYGAAAVWQTGVVTQLPVFQSVSAGAANAVNSSGQVVGYFHEVAQDGSGDTVEHAIMWLAPSYSIQDLGANAEAFSINDSGVVVGSAANASGGNDAVVWTNYQMSILPGLGGTESEAYSINDAGYIVGRSQLANGALHAALWIQGKVVDLTLLMQSSMLANETILGSQAEFINSAGQITVDASDSATGNGYTYLLTPVGATQVTASPLFSVIPRTYSTAQSIVVTDPSPNATIYFTTDGTTPTTASTRYTSPIVVGATSTLKAIAMAGAGYTASPVVSATYTIAIPAAPIPAIELASTDNVFATGSIFINPQGKGVDGDRNVIAADLLGSSLNWLGSEFAFAASNVPSATAATAISLTPGYYSNLNLLAIAVDGNHPQESFTVSYTDGSSVPIAVAMSDWATPQSYPGESVALTMDHGVTPTGTFAYGPYHLYGYSLVVDPSKELLSLTLPADKHIVVFGVAPANRVGGEQRVDLTDSFNLTGIFEDGKAPIRGGLDQADNAYSASLLGTSLSWNASIFQIGSSGFPDAVSDTTIALPPGRFATLKLLATAVQGNHASQSFIITYTDGTFQAITQSLSPRKITRASPLHHRWPIDWIPPAPSTLDPITCTDTLSPSTLARRLRK